MDECQINNGGCSLNPRVQCTNTIVSETKWRTVDSFFTKFVQHIHHSIALSKLYQTSFECKTIRWTVRSQIASEDSRRQMALTAVVHFLEFAAERSVRSSCTKKLKCRAFIELSIVASFIDKRRKLCDAVTVSSFCASICWPIVAGITSMRPLPTRLSGRWNLLPIRRNVLRQ